VNISIRQLAAPDFPEADRIIRSAFRTDDNRLAELERYLTFQTNGFFGAECDGKLTGTVGAVDFGAFAYLGMMAVDPSMQRRGIARALMQYILAWLDTRRCPSILLDASQYGQPLYADLGFVVEGQSSTFQNDAPPHFADLPQGVTVLNERDIPALAAFDAPIYGAARASVLQAFAAAFPSRAFVARDTRERITGFVFAQANRIGPWVAQDDDPAEKLLRAALTVRYDSTIRVIVPSPNVNAGELLARYGFQFSRTQAHMYRGAVYPARQRERIYGQVSFSIG
jgi:predicted N-acetyltransferase YhbS